MASAKYALSASRLRFSNGSTAMLFSGIFAGADGSVLTTAEELGACVAIGKLRYRAKKNVAMPTTTIAAAAVHSQTGSIFGPDAARSNFPFRDRRSASISAIFWYRSSLSLRNALCNIDCSSVGTAGVTRDRGGASVFRMDAMQSLGVAPENAGEPHTIS